MAQIKFESETIDEELDYGCGVRLLIFLPDDCDLEQKRNRMRDMRTTLISKFEYLINEVPKHEPLFPQYVEVKVCETCERDETKDCRGCFDHIKWSPKSRTCENCKSVGRLHTNHCNSCHDMSKWMAK